MKPIPPPADLVRAIPRQKLDLDLPDLCAKPFDRSGEEDKNLSRHRGERPIALVESFD